MNTTGLFGKLPSYGDFLCRDLNTAFTDVWDTWLQGFVRGGQEQLGDNWLDIYLTSPIWRFAFSPGVIDDNCWAGIMLPSVDKVGRYFPFSIVRNLGSTTAASVVNQGAAQWYDAVEDLALSALEGEILIDDLLLQVNSLPFDLQATHQAHELAQGTIGSVIKLSASAPELNALYPYFLDSTLRQVHTSYSMWHTHGSQLLEPNMFISKALPQINGIAAMLDGDWAESKWDEPFVPPYGEPLAQPQAEPIAQQDTGFISDE